MSRKLACLLMTLLLLGTLVAPIQAQGDDVPTTHTVQPGENLYRIAVHYNVTVDALMQANGLADSTLVIAGQVLVISEPVQTALAGAAPASTAPMADLTHTVAQGENLLRIALHYGVTVDAVMGANNIVDAGLIHIGQVLNIPVSSSPLPDVIIAPSSNGESIITLPVSGDNAGEAPVADTLDAEPVPAEVEVSAADPAPGAAFSQPDIGIVSPDIEKYQGFANFVTLGGPGLREIYLRGQALGNNPRAFSKIGDCNSEAPFFLAKFDEGLYELGPYAYLQPLLDHFAGSFARQSLAVWTGNHAWAVFDPTWANPAFCESGEMPIECEFRLNRPSVILVRLGTNEVGTPRLFEDNLRRIVTYSIEHGVIPVLGTKADRLEGDDSFNEIIRTVAVEFGVPLWDFGRAADLLPGHGLRSDGFHLNYFAPTYADARAYQHGHSVQNLTALLALDVVWRSVMY
jgi:LysM repeat protein